jgi:hypothetical protein
MINASAREQCRRHEDNSALRTVVLPEIVQQVHIFRLFVGGDVTEGPGASKG